MSENSKIEWTDHTWNGWIGCTKVSPGCDHCYAEARMDNRLHVVNWGAGQSRKRTSAANWREPIKWNAQSYYECPDCGKRGTARAMGDDPKECNHLNAKKVRQRVFCASLADVFDNEVPAAWRVDLVELIAETPNLDWLILTKRIGNAHTMWPAEPLPNVWLGATICNQEEADRDIPKLLQVPARVRFLSMEPLLAGVKLNACWLTIGCGFGNDSDPAKSACLGCATNDRCAWPSQKLDWVIAGGESGPHARPMHPDWARSLRDQCASAGVPFLFKQWGEWCPDTGPLSAGKDPIFEGKGPCARLAASGWEFSENGFTMPLSGAGGDWLYRLGKKAAGRLLDGRTHDEFPNQNTPEVVRANLNKLATDLAL